MKRQEKPFFVANLSEELKSAKGLVLVNFSGMTVKTQEELKKRLKGVGAKMLVVKNTLFKAAGESTQINVHILDDTILTGQNALVLFYEDPLPAIQALGKFAKEFEVPQIKVGIIEGVFQDTASLIKIASLPGREVLLGQLFGVLQKPGYGLVRTLKAAPQKLVCTLNAKFLMGGDRHD